MKVLIACEFSGIVREAFKKRGHNAWSCDLLETEIQGNHFKGNIFDILIPSEWDLIIAHPPCTALCVSGNSTYGNGKEKNYMRYESVEWTNNLWNKCINVCEKVCFENPVGVLSTFGMLPKPKYIQPYMFGHLESKKTGLFLYNLKTLEETKNVYDEMMKLQKKDREKIFYASPGAERWKLRSRTYQGIADAMAEQWG